MSERKHSEVTRRTQVFLVVAFLLTSLPLSVPACSFQTCSHSESHPMANCDGMEMLPQMAAYLHCSLESPCCQVSQATPPQLQQGTRTQIQARFVTFTRIDDTARISIQKQAATLSFTDPAPPDRQSFLCTLLI